MGSKYYIMGTALFMAASAYSQTLTSQKATELMTKSGCMVCHAIDKTKIGPSYQDVALHYAVPSAEVKAYLKGKSAADYLFEKVRIGTKPGLNKNWVKSKEGRAYGMMTPNPAGRISDENLKALIAFILAVPVAK